MDIHGKNTSMLTDRGNGFTLIELAIVLVIIGLLVGMGAGLMGPLTKRVKLNESRDTIKEVYHAITGYTAANKMLPADLTVLSTKTKDAYGKDVLYYPAGAITAADLCTTQGTYLTVNDNGTNKNNVAFIVFSQGALREEICNSFRIVTDSLTIGTEETVYSSTTLQATDGTPLYSWTYSGGLPPGLTLNVSGQITGTPEADGSYNFDVTVTDAEGRLATKSLVITIYPNDPTINTDVLHYSSVGTSYNAAIAASGGATPYSWSIISGSLPPGLSMAGNTISGVLTSAGTYAFTVQITDQRGRTATKTLSIAVNN
jgi:prepilin-type N-terminal cleavage/methylation domain-containing protein